MYFLNKNYGLNDYNMPILPYRMMGSNEYSESDIIDLTEDKIALLTDIFNKNNKDSVIKKVMTIGKKYRIDQNEKKLIEEPEIYANYMKVTLYQVIDEGRVIVDNYLDIFSFNDGKWGTTLYIKTHTTTNPPKTNVCEDFDGLLKYLHDLKFIIE